MKIFIFLILLSFFAFPTTAQIVTPNSKLPQAQTLELPSNFEYKRETGQVSGLPSFSLLPRSEAMSYDGARGSTFEALGIITQPERNIYGLAFINAKEKFQLHLQKTKGVTLTIDEEKFEIKTYKLVKRINFGRLKLEMASIDVDKNIFEKVVKASDVTIRVGTVTYNLDQDNIDAFRYFANEIEKDLARRAKN